MCLSISIKQLPKIQVEDYLTDEKSALYKLAFKILNKFKYLRTWGIGSIRRSEPKVFFLGI